MLTLLILLLTTLDRGYKKWYSTPSLTLSTFSETLTQQGTDWNLVSV